MIERRGVRCRPHLYSVQVDQFYDPMMISEHPPPNCWVYSHHYMCRKELWAKLREAILHKIKYFFVKLLHKMVTPPPRHPFVKYLLILFNKKQGFWIKNKERYEIRQTSRPFMKNNHKKLLLLRRVTSLTKINKFTNSITLDIGIAEIVLVGMRLKTFDIQEFKVKLACLRNNSHFSVFHLSENTVLITAL